MHFKMEDGIKLGEENTESILFLYCYSSVSVSPVYRHFLLTIFSKQQWKISHNNVANAKLGGNRRVNKQTNRNSARTHASTQRSGHVHVPARMQAHTPPHARSVMLNALIIDPSFLVCSSMCSASCPYLKVEIIVPISTLKFHLSETCFHVASWWLGSCLKVPIHTSTH